MPFEFEKCVGVVNALDSCEQNRTAKAIIDIRAAGISAKATIVV